MRQWFNLKTVWFYPRSLPEVEPPAGDTLGTPDEKTALPERSI
jgi:hypothetical protein